MFLCSIGTGMVMYCQDNFLEVMYWYWYYIFGNVMSNVMQYFYTVMLRALPVLCYLPSVGRYGVGAIVREAAEAVLLLFARRSSDLFAWNVSERVFVRKDPSGARTRWIFFKFYARLSPACFLLKVLPQVLVTKGRCSFDPCFHLDFPPLSPLPPGTPEGPMSLLLADPAHDFRAVLGRVAGRPAEDAAGSGGTFQRWLFSLKIHDCSTDHRAFLSKAVCPSPSLCSRQSLDEW